MDINTLFYIGYKTLFYIGYKYIILYYNNLVILSNYN